MIPFGYLDWPGSRGDWLVWGAILVVVFVIVERAGGTPLGVLALGTAAAGYSVDRHFYIPFSLIFAGLAFLIVRRRSGNRLSLSDVSREATLMILGFALYEFGRKITESGPAVAISNSARVLDFEVRLRLYFEPDLQHLALRSDDAVTILTRVYSSMFIPVVIGGLLWFLLADRNAYRVLRNALGISAAFSLLTFWLFPVAPPRLLPESGMIDLHNLVGRQHGFVNEFAAVPSLHVGWTMLVGYVCCRFYRGHQLRWLAWVPGTVMLFTVIMTGNHYWFDGAIGALYTLVPAAVLFNLPGMRQWWAAWMFPSPEIRGARSGGQIATHTWASLNIAALSMLLAFLVLGKLYNPDFTNYWGYMTAQITGTIIAVHWLSQRFAAEGGLSWLTHLIIVLVTYADTLGTAAGFYAQFEMYDKITHFGGGAILAAVAFEIILALRIREAIPWGLITRMAVAFSVALALGSLWELYEVFGDAIFDTGRHAGSLDTAYDIISDISGALLTVVLLARLEPARATARQMESKYAPTTPQIGGIAEPT